MSVDGSVRRKEIQAERFQRLNGMIELSARLFGLAPRLTGQESPEAPDKGGGSCIKGPMAQQAVIIIQRVLFMFNLCQRVGSS